MNAYAWERWSPAAGLIYVVLFVIAILTTPDTGETNREILEHYADEGNRRNDIILTALLAAASLAFVWFVSHLRTVLAAATTRSASALLFGLTPTDLPTLAGAAILLVSAALLAGGIPAFRAARIRPEVALRCD
jgi:hypothetical protein